MGMGSREMLWEEYIGSAWEREEVFLHYASYRVYRLMGLGGNICHK